MESDEIFITCNQKMLADVPTVCVNHFFFFNLCFQELSAWGKTDMYGSVD